MDLRLTIPYMACVNLGHREDRRIRVERQFRELGLEVRRQPGVRKERVRDTWGFQNESRYACSLAKRLAIRGAKLAGAPAMLLFEDDLILAPDLHERLAEVELPEDWGIFFLGCKHIERPLPIARNLLKVTRATDNHAIAIRAEYYDEMIRALGGTGKGTPRTIPYSDANASLVQRRIPAYAVFPNLAWQGFSLSDNEGKALTYYDSGGRQRSRRAVIEGLEEEMSHKFPGGDTKRKTPENTFLSAGENTGAMAGNTLADASPLHRMEEIFPLAFLLNRGADEGRRLESIHQFGSQGIAVRRIPVMSRAAGRVADGDEAAQALLLATRMALREACRRNLLSVMIVGDDSDIEPGFRHRLERMELPEDWGILILGDGGPAAGTLGCGWRRLDRVCDARACVIHAHYYKIIRKRMGDAFRSRSGWDTASVLDGLRNEVPIYGSEMPLFNERKTHPVKILSWLAEHHAAQALSASSGRLPPPGLRKLLIDQLGVDVFEDALHDFMRTA